MMTTEQLITLGVVAILSLFGGFVHWVRKPAEFHTFMEFVKATTTGCFTGILAFVALESLGDSMNIVPTLRYVIAGIASYIGGTLLDMSAKSVQTVAEQRLISSTTTTTTRKTTNSTETTTSNSTLPEGEEKK